MYVDLLYNINTFGSENWYNVIVIHERPGRRYVSSIWNQMPEIRIWLELYSFCKIQVINRRWDLPGCHGFHHELYRAISCLYPDSEIISRNHQIPEHLFRNHFGRIINHLSSSMCPKITFASVIQDYARMNSQQQPPYNNRDNSGLKQLDIDWNGNVRTVMVLSNAKNGSSSSLDFVSHTKRPAIEWKWKWSYILSEYDKKDTQNTFRI